jgi:hypothetical protein
MEFLAARLGKSLRSYGQRTLTISVGCRLETNTVHAGRAVIGDPTNDNRPMLPPPISRVRDPELEFESFLCENKIEYQWGAYIYYNSLDWR